MIGSLTENIFTVKEKSCCRRYCRDVRPGLGGAGAGLHRGHGVLIMEMRHLC